MKFKLILYSLLLSIPLLGNAATIDHFVTTWKTDNLGQSNSSSITLPMIGGPYSVDWNNDGIFDEFNLTGWTIHDFGSPGTYTVRVDGTYRGLQIYLTGDEEKFLSVDQWGTNSWIRMNYAFAGCPNLKILATDIPNFSNTINMHYMFFGTFLANPNTSNWDTSSVQTMHSMFEGALAATPDTSNWDVSNVNRMDGMFKNAVLANPNTSNWNTSSVTTMSSMFHGAENANPDTSGWDTSLVNNMYLMFSGAISANPDTSNWNTSSVTNMHSMFANTLIANPDTSTWDTSLVTDMSDMFYQAMSANPDTSNWDVSSVAVMSYMFYKAPLANPDTSNWNTSSLTSSRYMFAGAASANPDVSGWNMSSVRTMQSMFADTNVANPNVSNWDTSSAVNVSGMFRSALAANPDVSKWNVSSVIDAKLMFSMTTLSRANYEALLIGWSAQPLQSEVIFDGGNSTYCSDASVNARANMINLNGWTITDGGKDCGTNVAPSVITRPATNITDTSAFINGSANPNGFATTVWFEWGLNNTYSNTVYPSYNIGSGTEFIDHYRILNNLECDVVYHYRLGAYSEGGMTYGEGQSFTPDCDVTPTTPPVANFEFSCVYLNCTFDASNSTGNIITYMWSF